MNVMIDDSAVNYKKDELISIVVPVYNVENYIHRCLASLCNQTYKNLQIILINDGSTDSSRKMCEAYLNKDSRIILIDEAHCGPGDARNRGILSAKGEYITFVDSDDYISDDYVEYLYNLIKLKDADIAICESHKFWSDSVDIKKINYNEKVEIFMGNAALENMLYQKGISHTVWGKIYKTSLFEEISFPANRWFEDYGIIYKIFYKSKCVVYGKKQNYFYFQRSGSIMSSEFSMKNMDRFYLTDEMLKFIKQNCPDMLKAAETRAFITYLILLRDCPRSTSYSAPYKKICDNIRCYRRSVVLNHESKLSTRGIALLSCLSISGVKRVGMLQRRWKDKRQKEGRKIV